MSDEENSRYLQKGTFVIVGEDLGIVVGLPCETNVPEDHYAIWFGEGTDKKSVPLCKTVPVDCCEEVSEISFYH